MCTRIYDACLELDRLTVRIVLCHIRILILVKTDMHEETLEWETMEKFFMRPGPRIDQRGPFLMMDTWHS